MLRILKLSQFYQVHSCIAKLGIFTTHCNQISQNPFLKYLAYGWKEERIDVTCTPYLQKLSKFVSSLGLWFRVMLKARIQRVNLRNQVRPAVYPHPKDLKKVNLSCGPSEVLGLFRTEVLGIQTELGPRIISRLYYPNYTLYTFGSFVTKVIIEVLVS